MGAPQTLPANFDQWDKTGPPTSLPADFNQWDKPKPASAASRLGSNFLSGLGVTDDEAAKNFFAHPLDTVIKSFEAQGELAKKARAAYDKGDYEGALQHSLNYLVPFVGQQTDQAGEQLKEGDIAGGIGRTLGVAAPIVAGSPETQTAASDAAHAVAAKARPATATVLRTASDVISPDVTGVISPRAAHFQRLAGKLADAFEKKAAPIAAALDATGENKPFAGGMDEYQPKPARALDATGENRPFAGGMDEPRIPAATPVPVAPGAAGSMAESVAQPPVATPPVAPPVDPLLERLRAFAANLPPDEGELPPTKSLTPKLKTMLRTVNKIKQAAAPETPVVPPDDADLTSLLQQSLRRVRSLKELQ